MNHLPALMRNVFVAQAYLLRIPSEDEKAEAALDEVLVDHSSFRANKCKLRLLLKRSAGEEEFRACKSSTLIFITGPF